MKTYLIYPLFISLLVAMLLTCGTEPENRSIHGFVYDTANSEPVPGVVVTSGGLTDTTSFEGYFDLGTLPSGQYELQTNRVCYENNMQSIDVVDGANEIIINLSLEEYPVSRIYDIEWINASTLDKIRKNQKKWVEWPEVIELDNNNFEFSGRVKLGKNGWIPIVPEWLEYFYLYNAYYPIPITVPDPNVPDQYYSYEHLYFVHVEFKNAGKQIYGGLGNATVMNDIGESFIAVFRPSQ